MADTLITGNTLVESKIKLDIKSTQDSADYDFILSDLTTDGAWRSLDISNIVPNNTEWIILNVNLKDDAPSSSIQFNGIGITNRNRLTIQSQVANVSTEDQGWVKIGSSRLLYYIADSLTFTNINIKITGYV